MDVIGSDLKKSLLLMQQVEEKDPCVPQLQKCNNCAEKGFPN